MFNSQGKSLRIKIDNELLPDVHIENVARGFVSARLDSTCQPSSYRWEIKGKTYAMDADITSGVALPLTAQADKGISLVLDNAPVTQVLQALAENQNVNLMIAPGVEGTLSA